MGVAESEQPVGGKATQEFTKTNIAHQAVEIQTDDALMPAVDWPLDGGLTPSEVIGLGRPLVSSGLIVGMDVTIYNPSLDTSDHAAGRVLLDVVEALRS